jgi:hypothetical protein
MKAMEAFENAGGMSDDFERQKMEAATGALADGMGACIKKSAAVKTAPTQAEIDACDTAAMDAFARAGGDSNDFARAQMDGAANAAGSAMESCAKLEFETLGIAENARPTEAQWKTIHEACDAAAKADFLASGGDAANFELAVVEGASSAISESFSTCLDSTAADASYPTNVELDACAMKAKEAYENAGGSVGDFERRQAGAAASSLASTIELCLKDAAIADAPTEAEFDACSAKGRVTFAKAGGDPSHFYLAQRDGAQGTATDVLQSCLGADTATSRRRLVATLDAAAVATCRTSAKKAFVQAGGNEADFDRVQEAGARDAMMEKMEVCAENKIAELDLPSGTTASAAQSQTAFSDCNEDSRQYFLQNGGDAAMFQEEMAEGARDMVSEVMTTCLSTSAADIATDAEVDACETKAKELAANLGDPPERFERTKQEGARKALSSTLETCMKGATTDDDKATCTDTAIATFTAAGGDVLRFADEQRQGAGKVAGDQLKSCLNYAADTTAEDACQVTAKEAHINAGGNTQDYWYDAKNGLMSDTVTFNSICASDPSKTAAVCTAESKEYFTTVLKVR